MAARSNHAILAAAGILLLASLLLVASAASGSAAPQTRLTADARAAQECPGVAMATAPPPDAGKPPTDRRPVTIDPTEPTAAPDSEWLLLPKSHGDALLELIWAPQYANANRLLRSTTFNPRDQCLPVSSRRAVASTIAELAATIQGLLSEFTATQDREFAALHAQGRTTEVDIGVHQGIFQLEKIGADPVFKELSGKTWGVSMTRLPETSRVEWLLRDAGAALVARLAEIFAAAGALSATEREALATRASSAAAPSVSHAAVGRGR